MRNQHLVEFEDGVAIWGTFPSPDVLGWIQSYAKGPLPLVVADPPYGNIVSEKWDRVGSDDKKFCQWMVDWTKDLQELSLPGAALYVFGGVGLPALAGDPPFRPFLRYLVEVELQTGYQLSTPITWKKKRAYGIQWGYLFTREEIAYLVNGPFKKPRQFTIPLLSVKRGYAGYDENYPAKSEYLRRTNVWDDVTEIFRGKVHVNQKPQKLVEIPIEIHTQPGECVLDPFAGSGTTAMAARALGRRFIVVEQDETEFERLVARLRGEVVPPLSEKEDP
jgi:site-specific DNA-methyltransferase (adenine-specific)